MFSGLFRLFGGLAGALNKWFGMKERKEHRQAGANEEILRQREDVEDAEDSMDNTPRRSRADVVGRLRKNGDI